jgi:NADH:ubiquinone oxidoreductase subunit 2 (subunit N)
MMSLIIIVLFVVGCVIAYKAFTEQNPKQKKLYGLIALFIGGVLFVLGNYVPR